MPALSCGYFVIIMVMNQSPHWNILGSIPGTTHPQTQSGFLFFCDASCIQLLFSHFSFSPSTLQTNPKISLNTTTCNTCRYMDMHVCNTLTIFIYKLAYSYAISKFDTSHRVSQVHDYKLQTKCICQSFFLF